MASSAILWSTVSVNPAETFGANPVFTPYDSDLLVVDLVNKGVTSADTISGDQDGSSVTDILELQGGPSITSVTLGANFVNVSGFELTIVNPDTEASLGVVVTELYASQNDPWDADTFQIAAKPGTTKNVTIDVSSLDPLSTRVVSASLGDGNDVYFGTDGLDSVLVTQAGTTAGNDAIHLGGGNDLLVINHAALTADDTLDGGAGNDELELVGDVTIVGAAEFANVKGFERFAIGVSAVAGSNLTWMLGDITYTTLGITQFDLSIGDKISSETVVVDGSGLTNASNTIRMLENFATGTVTVFGGVGPDTLLGAAAGSSSLSGGAGADLLVANASGYLGLSYMFGGTGADTILGGPSSDIIGGDADNDALSGGSGADSISGGTGADSLLGGDGNDTLNGGLDVDTIDGGYGDDTVVFGTEAGDGGGDQVKLGPGADVVQLKGSLAAPIVISDFGFGDKITLFDAGAPVAVASSPGGSLTSGAWEVVTIAGGIQINVGLDAAAGADASVQLMGLSINNIDGSTGSLEYVIPAGFAFTVNNDVLTGTALNDTFSLTTIAGSLSVADVIDGGAGTDRILITGGTQDFSGFSSTNLKSIEIIETSGPATVVLPTAVPITFLDNASDQLVTVSGGTGHKLFLDMGGTGDEVLLSGGTSELVMTHGKVTVTGGTHTLFLSTQVEVSAASTMGFIGRWVGGPYTTVFGSSGNDQLYLDVDADIDAGEGNDIVVLSNIPGAATGGEGADTLFGGSGNDTLVSGLGFDDQASPDIMNDVLVAGAGNDFIVIGGGADSAWGGAGADLYVILDGGPGSSVTVFDYNAAEDFLDFSDMAGILHDDVHDALDAATIFTNAISFVVNNTTITLVGVTNPDDIYFYAQSGIPD